MLISFSWGKIILLVVWLVWWLKSNVSLIAQEMCTGLPVGTGAPCALAPPNLILAELLEQWDAGKERGHCSVKVREARGDAIPDTSNLRGGFHSYGETRCISFSARRTACNNRGFLFCCSFVVGLKIKLALLLIYPEMLSACHFFNQKA